MAQAAAKQLQVAADNLQHIVEVVRDPPGELANRLEPLGLRQGRFGGTPLGLALEQLARALTHPLLQPLTVLLQLHLAALLLGHIVALDEDSRYLTIVLDDRLVDEIDEDFFLPHAGLSLQECPHTLADIGLAGCIDVIEQTEKRLPLYLGKPFADPLADQLPISGQLLIRIVDELEYMVGAAQEADEARRLGEQHAHPIAFVLQRPGPPEHSALELLHRLLTDATLAERTRGGALQLGDVHGVLQDGDDFAVLIEDRRVRRAPVAILVLVRAGALQSDGITDHRQRIDALAADGALQGIQQLSNMCRLGTLRIDGECLMQPPPANRLERAPRQRQVRRVGIDDDQLRIEQNISIGRQTKQALE